MTTLVALLSTGKGTWGLVAKLMKTTDWEQIILVCPQFAIEKFSHEKDFNTILMDSNIDEVALRDQIKSGLDNFKLGAEVALNLSSGTGKEHMSLMGALIRSGVGIRLVVPKDNSFVEI